jgi:hypothetical protein
MDPNACLKEMLEIAASFTDGHLDDVEAQRLAELVDALDGWLTNGGFLPERWDRPMMLTCSQCKAVVDEIRCRKCGADLSGLALRTRLAE